MKKKIFWGLFGLFILLQFIQPDRSVPAVNPSSNFENQLNIAPATLTLLKNACYDCHSFETENPWYNYVAPVSYWIQHHVNEAREELNFSEWAAYDIERKAHKIEECVEMIQEGEMPLASFTWMHPEAKLDDTQKQSLMDFFQGLPEAGMGHSKDLHHEADEEEGDED